MQENRPFLGTAEDYSQFRVPYPETLIDDLGKHAGLSGSGKLLDLGCGPGRATLPLCRYFSECIAVDIEPEMIAFGKNLAKSKGINHIRWIVGSSETVDLPSGEFELVTIGEAFHRMDRTMVAKRAFKLLKPGGWIALLWQEHFWHSGEPWARAAVRAINRWTTRKVSTKREEMAARSREPFEGYLSSSGFQNIERMQFEVHHKWNIESILGFLRSTSFASREALAENYNNLELYLRRGLAQYNPDGVYSQAITFGFIVGRRPG